MKITLHPLKNTPSGYGLPTLHKTDFFWAEQDRRGETELRNCIEVRGHKAEVLLEVATGYLYLYDGFVPASATSAACTAAAARVAAAAATRLAASASALAALTSSLAFRATSSLVSCLGSCVSEMGEENRFTNPCLPAALSFLRYASLPGHAIVYEAFFLHVILPAALGPDGPGGWKSTHPLGPRMHWLTPDGSRG